MEDDELPKYYCGGCGLIFDESDIGGPGRCPECGATDVGEMDDPEVFDF